MVTKLKVPANLAHILAEETHLGG